MHKTPNFVENNESLKIGNADDVIETIITQSYNNDTTLCKFMNAYMDQAVAPEDALRVEAFVLLRCF